MGNYLFKEKNEHHIDIINDSYELVYIHNTYQYYDNYVIRRNKNGYLELVL